MALSKSLAFLRGVFGMETSMLDTWRGKDSGEPVKETTLRFHATRHAPSQVIGIIDTCQLPPSKT
jgi:hypothetical protein